MTQSFWPMYRQVTLERSARGVIRAGINGTRGDATLWGGGVRG